MWRSGDIENKVLSEHVDIHRPERVRYLPQSYFERLCSEIGVAAQEEFEKQLKQVVFTWLPTDRRLEAGTLDDLIHITTVEWRERQRLRKNELAELNERIATIERQIQPTTVTDVRSQLRERQRELQAHEARRPEPILEPSGSDSVPDEQLVVITRIEVEISTLDQTLQESTAALASLRRRRQDLQDLDSKLTNVGTYFDNQLRTAAVGAVLQAEALTFDAIVELRINRSPLTEATRSLDEQIEMILASQEEFGAGRLALEVRRQVLLTQLDEERRARREARESLQRWEEQKSAIEGAPNLDGTIVFLRAALDAVPYVRAVLGQALADRNDLLGQMFDDLARLRESYIELFEPVQEYLEGEELLGDGLTMRVDALIREEGFAETLLGFIDRTRRGEFHRVGDDELDAQLAGVDFGDITAIRAFVNDVVSKLIPYAEGIPADDLDRQLRGRATREEVYDYIFGLDYLEPHYALTFNDKQIAQLSPGERGAALLIFYLLVDKSDIPILLDQPEENLDNATVSRLLVPAIRKARQRRQVILVTHNPNLAVYCDADQVVLCDINRAPSTRITYESGAIEDVATRRWLIDVLEGTGRAFGKRYDKYGIGPDGELVLRGD